MLPVEAANTFKPTIAAAATYTLQIRADGTLWSWGDNTYGTLGDGTLANHPAPAQIGGGYVQVSAGDTHAAAIKTDGSLWAWGNNDAGQLGDGTRIQRNTPVKIGEGYSQVAAGYYYTVAIKADGTLWAWGDNQRGQLGDGTTTYRYTPVQIGSDYVQVAAGLSHVLAVKADGTLWAWGNNSTGQLGDGTTISRTTPEQIGSDFAQAAAGGYFTVRYDELNWRFGITVPLGFSVAVKRDGTLWSWGNNDHGQLGDGSTVNRLMPFQVGTGFTQATAGADYALAVKSDGTLMAWGSNENGQLGDGTYIDRHTPLSIDSAYAQAAAGSVHSIGLKMDASSRVWGKIWGERSPRLQPTPTLVLFPDPATLRPRLVNLSSRANTLTGDGVAITGFIVGGGSKTVLISARGPSLAMAGVTNVLGNPKLRLLDSTGKLLATNDDWSSDSNAPDIIATQGAPSDAKESAILATLPPGAYTAIMDGVNGGTGTGLLSVDGVSKASDSGLLVNLSSRAMVGTDDGVVIAGFIIADGPRKVLLTARGPSLAAAGVNGVLSDPMIELHDNSGRLIDQNDDLTAAVNYADIIATGKAPVDSHESALLLTLQPGAYTLVVRGKSRTQGIALVAVDQID